MFRSIKEIHQAFDRAGIKHKVEENRSHWILITGMTGDHSKYQFLFIKSDDKGNDVVVRSLPIVSVPRSRYDQAYELLNSLQQEYRFIKFILDKDGDVIVAYDFPVAYPDIGQGAVEILLRMAKIVDNCYPKLARLSR